MIEQLKLLLDAAQYRLSQESPSENYYGWKHSNELVLDLRSALSNAENYHVTKENHEMWTSNNERKS